MQNSYGGLATLDVSARGKVRKESTETIFRLIIIIKIIFEPYAESRSKKHPELE